MPLGPTGSRFEREALVIPRLRRGAGEAVDRERGLLWSTRRYPHHDPFSERAVIFSTLLFSWVVLNLMDAATTVFATRHLGWGAEGNLLLRFVGERLGVVGFLFYKSVMVALVVTVLWLFHRGILRAESSARAASSRRSLRVWLFCVEAVTGVLVVAYLAIVVNNVTLILGVW